MADGVVVLVPIKALAQFFFIQAVVIAQPADNRFMLIFLLLYAEVELSAVTGRQYHASLHHWLSQQALQRLVERIWRKRYTFSQRYRGCFVVNAKS